jgi:hypothetical protein
MFLLFSHLSFLAHMKDSVSQSTQKIFSRMRVMFSEIFMLHRNSILRVALAATLASTSSLAQTARYNPIEIEASLTADDGTESINISGVSCLPPVDGKYICLVIDDEGRMAQAAALDASRLSGRGKIRIFGKAAPPGIVGSVPRADACSKGEDNFKDLDGEAVAYDGRDFYVVGSHGCSRHNNKFRASSFILARIPRDVVIGATAADAAVYEGTAVSTTYRLSEALLVAPHVRNFFSHNLMTDNGLNIEGLLVVKGKLYAGLRAPVVGGQAYLIAVDAEALFDAKRPIAESDVSEFPLALGNDRGIRDLAVLSDGRILVLSGPAQDGDVPFALHIVDPNGGWTAKQIAVLDDLPIGSQTKAEGLHVLAENDNTLDLLVMFDGPKSGGPRRYTVVTQ